ncbi:MAG TPA: hypothetical protein VKT27_00875 [Candidatus Binataceae bacterium]|nr:hypothetical protein [Candidatus Binataceae bacterium]
MARNYLQGCFEAFKEVTEKVFGTASDLAAIETSVAPLRDGVALNYEDLKKFESPSHWEFKTWWVFPPEQHVTPELRRRKFNFRDLPQEERNVVASLLDVFKSIELVSIILRFIRPELYGIISPPVERILDVRRESDAVQTYLNYLDNLRKVAKHYHFRRVADADMALWVLHERCFGGAPNEATRKAYDEDRFIRSLRAENLMKRFLDDCTYAQLAHSLFRTDPVLAGQLGGIEFEQMVRRYVPAGTNWDDVDFKDVINELYRRGTIDTATQVKWHRARITRNQAIHMNPLPDSSEVKKLLDLLDLSGREPAHQKH